MMREEFVNILLFIITRIHAYSHPLILETHDYNITQHSSESRVSLQNEQYNRIQLP